MAGGPTTVVDSYFLGNRSHDGGAIYAFNALTLIDTVFSGNQATAAPSSNSLPSGGYGGAIVASGSTSLSGVVLSNNSAAENAGGLYVAGDHTEVFNSILWGNTVTKATEPGADPIPIVKQQIHKGNGTADIFYSLVQGLLETIPGEDPPNPADFPGSIDDDPGLVDADGSDDVSGTEDDDVRLGAGSPAIDAGDNGLIPAGVVADLDGNTRRFDDSATVDTGAGSPPIVDMGAYEFGAAPPSECGNGTIESGEQCDDGGTADADCCSSACQYESSGTACGDDGNACTVGATCDGAGLCGTCNVGAVCGAACGVAIRCKAPTPGVCRCGGPG